MARRSPPVVNQKIEVGCTWRMFGIFNFRQGHSSRRLISNERHLNTLAFSGPETGNGNSKSSSGVISTVDEKYPHVGVSSRRRGYGYGCKSMSSCVENDQVANRGNKVTKMIVEPSGCEPKQFLDDAVQILYSNKELFLKLLQDPNSLLVKQIHDSQSSNGKEPYQSMQLQTKMTRLNESQNNNTRQCGKTLKPGISTKIAVLKPSTVAVKPHSSSGFFGHNVQNIKPSHFPFVRMKRKLKYIMKVRRKEQQRRRRATDGVPYRNPCGCLSLKDDKKVVKESNIDGTNSLTYSHASIDKRLNSSLDLKERHKIIKEVASFGESCNRHMNNTSIGPFEQNILNLHVEGRKGISEILNCGSEEFNNYQMVLGTKLGLQKEGGNGSYSSMGQEFNIVKTHSGKLQLLDADVSPRKSPADDNLHAHYDIPRDGGGYEDSPTQNSDINNSTKGTESFLDSHPEIHRLEGAVSNNTCESDAEHFTREDVTKFQPDEMQVAVHDNFEENHVAALIRSSLDSINNFTSSKDILDYYTREILQNFSLKWDELLVMKCESSDSLCDPFIFDELEGSISQFSGDRVLLDFVMEAFMLVYQKCSFPSHISTTSSNVQAYIVKKVLLKEITELINLYFLPRPSRRTLEQLVEMDLARRGSWLNIQAYTEDIVMQVAEGVLEKLVLEIVSVIDTKTMIHC